MYKKAITFVNFEGETVTEDHYFNLSKAELIKAELTQEGSTFTDHLQAVVKSNNGKLIIETFEEIILLAYGIRVVGEDGKARFKKSAQISEEFKSTEAYSELFSEILLGGEAAVDFVKYVVPADLSEAAEQAVYAQRSDGRPALQDHLKKQTPAKQTTDLVADEPEAEELRVIAEPASAPTVDELEAFRAWQATQKTDGNDQSA